MKKIFLSCRKVVLLIPALLFFASVHASGDLSGAEPGLRLRTVSHLETVSVLGPESGSGFYADGWFAEYDGLFGDKKKKKKRKRRKKKHSPHFFGTGILIGGPADVAGRVVIKPGIVALAGDVSANIVRAEDGSRLWATFMKVDGRLYGRGLLDQLVHPYLFVGAGAYRVKYEEVRQTAWLGDLGLGAEVKFGRLGINGDVGMMIPVKAAADFRPGWDFYGSVGVIWWWI